MKFNSYKDNAISDKENLFNMVDKVYSDDARNRIGTILNKRIFLLECIFPELSHLNLECKVNSEQYHYIVNSYVDEFTEEDVHIERLALREFDNYAEFWCEYEIYKIREKYKNNCYYSQSSPLKYDESEYCATMFKNVECIYDLYRTTFEEFSMLLPDAILLSNLHSSVKNNKWYEVLYSLDLSVTGTHFVLYISTDENINVIVSTARIQYWCDKDNWLYRSSFFRSDIWNVNYNKRVENYLKKTMGIDEVSKLKYQDIASFEDELMNAIVNKNLICEIIRLTTSGSLYEKSFILYLAQKEMLRLLKNMGMSLAFIIVEQPMITAFYNSFSDNSFLCIGTGKIKNEGNIIYKGLWVVNKIERQFRLSSYTDYKKAYFLRNKVKSSSVGVLSD